MLREIRDLGFDHAELSHGTRLGLVPGILEAVNAGEIKISSLHNFCPLPLGVEKASPNLYEFSDERDRQRELAIKHTLKTFEFAERVKAPVVVLHLGSIDMKDYTGKLTEMLERGEKKDSPKYEKLYAETAKAIAAKKDKFFGLMKDTLRKILPEAEKRGIKLGCENRQAMEEIPIDGDFPAFFREFQSPSIGYWHDFGHAQIKENFGFLNHKAHLDALHHHLIGFHIHDVKFPAGDHMPPGTGTVNFGVLKPFVKPHHVKVFELSPSLRTEAAKCGVAHVKLTWGPE